MLQAILKAKVATLFDESLNGESFADKFRGFEDFLTAAVFERLRYLPADLFWKVLYKATIPSGSLPLVAGDFKESAFWPTWQLSPAISDRKRCIPDVLLSFEKVDLVVEAKRYDHVFSQDAEQLALEWLGYYEQIQTRQMWLLMVSGIGEVTHDCVMAFHKEIEKALHNLRKESARVQLVGTSWQLIAKALHEVVADEQVGVNSLIVINDILDALQLYDIQWRQPAWLESLWQESSRSHPIRGEAMDQFARRVY